MARSLLEVPAGSQWSSKAGKRDGGNRLTGAATKVEFWFVKLLCSAIAISLQILDIWMKFSDVCTDTGY